MERHWRWYFPDNTVRVLCNTWYRYNKAEKSDIPQQQNLYADR
ncbi:hypothetical protein M2137_001257 [Parabacteroides sp. PFB2-10]|nr:hypothetical protein [Parabacteroides sp. PFB2-10]MDH6312486.1 hypothetical protein [Parabacteroides sp. PFB2-10]